ncbi:MAG TPA: HD domain-containing protein [Dongiaceae bacterium]|jgi:(p)ppGpp synthase/HD superfamily hydrolase
MSGNQQGARSEEAPLLLFARALDFAARKHVHQRRKGESAEPYINHLSEVARLLAAATEGRNAAVTVAGLLHDTLEDTATSYDELVAEFGDEIASLVLEVTDDKALPKAERKRLQEEHARHASAGAKMIKIADKTSNLHSIVNSPPSGWDLARKREYFDWAKRVVAGCRGVSDYLDDEFERAWRLGAERFGLTGG